MQEKSSKIGLKGSAGILTAALRNSGFDLEAVESQLLFLSRKHRVLSEYREEHGGGW